MSKFKITWSNGNTTHEECEDWKTVDDMAMARWGRNSAKTLLNEFAIKIELVDAPVEEPKAEEPKAEEPSE